MKKYFTLLLFFTALLTSAQNFHVEPANVLNKTITPNDISDLNINIIRNNTVDTLYLEYELITNTLPNEWYQGYCDNHGCWGSLPISGVMSPCFEDLNSYIKLSIHPNGFDDAGVVEYYVYETGHYEDGILLTFNVDTPGFVGTEESIITNFQFYPNPFTNQLKIQATTPISEISVYDITGRLVIRSSQIHSGNFQFDSQNWQKGIYLLEMKLEDGTIETRKISKK